jgi:hypothetical protein
MAPFVSTVDAEDSPESTWTNFPDRVWAVAAAIRLKKMTTIENLLRMSASRLNLEMKAHRISDALLFTSTTGVIISPPASFTAD